MKRFLVLALFLLSFSCASPEVDLLDQAPPTVREEPAGYEVAVVTRVVDGDTIEVEIRDRVPGPGAGEAEIGPEHDVRLIGIDTPESVKPDSPVECFGREASAAAKELLEGKEVRLVKDVEETDRFGRLLRYVYIGDEMANARLVVNGYAFAYTYPPNVRHSLMLQKLEGEAREAERGLWSPQSCNGQAVGASHAKEEGAR